MSKSLRRVRDILISLFIFFAAIEISFFAFYSFQEKSIVSPSHLYKKYYPFYSIETGECSWAQEAGLHPYLSIAYPAKETCQDPARNAYGLRSAPFPDEYNPDFFTILIIGGSVAEQLGGLSDNAQKRNYLEETLENHWVSPTKKPFKVLNASVAGSSQPSNTIQALLFSPLADLIVDVEGFNEFVKYSSVHRLESPVNAWLEAAYQFEHPFRFYFLNRISNWGRNHSAFDPFGYSYGVYAMFHYYSESLKAHYEDARKNLEPFPDYPDDWSQERRNADYLRNQGRYLIQTDAIAKSIRKKYVLFIQPTPLQFKPLTEAEHRVAHNIAYSEDYGIVRENLLKLRQSKIAVEDLGHIFENETSSLYVDHIHTNENGVKIMSREIAERLAKRYGWKTR